ncbi:MAG: hypothetical protein R3E60_01775 [Alphaproteobacteria bacterium]
MYDPKNRVVAQIVVGIGVAGLLFFGLQMLTIPRIFMLIRRPDAILPYEGPALVILAVLLAWFRKRAMRGLLWVFMETPRLISSLAIAAVIGAEGFMHMFTIPHLEGWWIPVLSGSTAATFGAWFYKCKKEASTQEKKCG